MKLFITPHPPIIIDKIGRGEQRKAAATIDGMNQIAKEIKQIKPKTIAVITPHGNVFSDALCINVKEKLSGSFRRFGQPGLSYKFDNDVKKAQRMINELEVSNIRCLALDKSSAKRFNISPELDHGVLVPLHFITKQYTDFKLIHISIGYLMNTKLYQAGSIISEILGDDNVLIVSGDLSHRLDDFKHDYDSMGKVYDDYIVDLVKNNRFIDLLDIDTNMADKAGQCAQKPLELFIGALEGHDAKSTVFSYEGPYGVGYMTAMIMRGEKNDMSIIADYLSRKKVKFKSTLTDENQYVALARKTIDEYIKNKRIIDIPDNLSGEFYTDRNGTFVSIKKEGRLRGCIGTIGPTRENIAQEIIHNAISAATKDPRFNEIKEDELEDLQISVDILFEPEDIETRSGLDVKEYGVIVTKGYKRGLLLPNLEGINSVDEQISIALKKAGISERENYSMQRFRVIRHK